MFRHATRRSPHVIRLNEVADQLATIQSAVVVAVSALRAQNADIDADVARLLIRCVSDPLQTQVESINSVAHALSAVSQPLTRKKR